MATWNVRAGGPEDAAGLRALNVELQEYERAFCPCLSPGEDMVDAYMEQTARELADPARPGIVLVAEADIGGLVGFVSCLVEDDLLERDRRGAWIEDLVVAAAWRGRGVGRSLIERAVAFATTQGAHRVRISARVENADAIAMYEHLGFAPSLVTLERAIDRGATT